MAKMRLKVAAVVLAAVANPANAQNPVAGAPAGQTQQQQQQQPPTADSAQALRPTYVLQTGDQIVIRSLNVEEIADRPFRIESDGTVTLPQVGQVRLTGLTIEAAETELKNRYKRFVIDPQIVILVASFQNPPVFFVGYFKAPGVYTLIGKRTLVDMMTQVGGLALNASKRIRVSRRIEQGKIPLATSILSPDGKTSYVDINIGNLQTSMAPAEDIVLEPFDIISGERAEMIFMMGAVGRVGGIELGDRKQLSMLQALAMSGGLSPLAKADKAYVLRPVLDSAQRAQIVVDLNKIQKGEANDFPLLSNDVLFIPTSKTQAAIARLSLVGTGLLTNLPFLFLNRR